MTRRRSPCPLLACIAACCAGLAAGQSPAEGARPFPSLTDSGPDAGAAGLSGAAAGVSVAARPANVSGTYRGGWSGKAMPADAAKASSVFGKSDGIVILQLNSSASSHAGVHHIEGEMMLRDGPYMGQADLVLRLAGVYVPASGLLHALLESKEEPLALPFAPSDADPASPHYRQALRHASQRLAASGGDGSGLDGALSPQQQLGLDTLPLSLAADGVPAQVAAVDLGRGGSVAEQLGLSRNCDFVLNLAVSAPPDADGAAAENSTALANPKRQRRGADSSGAAEEIAAEAKEAARKPDLTLNGTLASAACGISLELHLATTHIEQYYAKAVNYTLLIIIVSFLQILLLVRQMEATATQARAASVSLLCIGQQAVMDAYLCLLHLTTGIMVEPLFNAFATAAFFEFVIFAIFEMRWLLLAWRARHGPAHDGQWQQQRELSLIYARFYGALLIGILMTYQLQRYMKYVVFALYSWWIPQIVMSAVGDSRQPLKPWYVVGTSVTRLALPLYLYACPTNLLRMPPSPAIALGLVAFVGAQAGLLLAQHWYGPRCFVPKLLLPPKYDYFRPVRLDPKVLESGGSTRDAAASAARGGSRAGSPPDSPRDEEMGHGVECVICMNPVDVATPSARMVAPCDHIFHTDCLQRWMDVKMCCPTCRRILPPP